MGTNKVWLNEASFMRPILLVLLVSYHSFAPWVGSWPMMQGIHEFELYKWIGLLSRAFRLEGFIFISGYIFTFQILSRNKYHSLYSLIKSKIKRLYIPSIIFSILYFLCFLQFRGLDNFILSIVGGSAHLWYLPCLFWCFIIQYVFLKKEVPPPPVCLLMLIVGVAVSFINLPLNLNKPLYYMLFFYGGGLCYRYGSIIQRYVSRHIIIMSWITFVILFVFLNLIMEYNRAFKESHANLLISIACGSANALLKAILGWSGIAALYLTASVYCMTHKVGPLIIKIGSCGYGVYVFHQFILVYLYRYTTLPGLVGTYLLPWLGFAITVIVSVMLTLLVRSTKVGRVYL